jgi:peptidoglycan/LPS O-acetylase OafA/YrhL
LKGLVFRLATFDAGATFDAEVCRSRKAFANFLFQNNQLINGGCYNITWTLAVQMQFYLLFPLCLLLLQPRRRGFRYLFQSTRLVPACRHAISFIHLANKAAGIHCVARVEAAPRRQEGTKGRLKV